MNATSVNRNRIDMVLLASLLGLWAGTAPGMPASATEQAPIVIETAQTSTLHDLVARLRKQRLVFVGETHLSAADHQLQLDILKGMADQGAPLVLGVEWFQRPFQSVLDDYIAARIDEAALLRRSEYFTRWGFDYRLYRPIMQFAREHGIRVLALNAARELTDAVRKQGLEQLPAADREKLPASYNFSDQGYRERLRKVFALHQRHGQDENTAFQRFVEVQLTWDETMAETAADYLRDHPDSRMLVLAGKGHTQASAIPERVRRRIGDVGTTVGSMQIGAPFNQADFLVFQAERDLPPQGVIGVALDQRDDGLYISAFSPGSKAQDAGVHVGDRLLAIDGSPIKDFTDVKLTMIDREPEQQLSLSLQRDGLFGTQRRIEASVPLIRAMSRH
jgi:uncharacterized iron-regulated protein